MLPVPALGMRADGTPEAGSSPRAGSSAPWTCPSRSGSGGASRRGITLRPLPRKTPPRTSPVRWSAVRRLKNGCLPAQRTRPSQITSARHDHSDHDQDSTQRRSGHRLLPPPEARRTARHRTRGDRPAAWPLRLNPGRAPLPRQEACEAGRPRCLVARPAHMRHELAASGGLPAHVPAGLSGRHKLSHGVLPGPPCTGWYGTVSPSSALTRSAGTYFSPEPGFRRPVTRWSGHRRRPGWIAGGEPCGARAGAGRRSARSSR